jgi:hypothetical protein
MAAHRDRSGPHVRAMMFEPPALRAMRADFSMSIRVYPEDSRRRAMPATINVAPVIRVALAGSPSAAMPMMKATTTS